MRRFVKFGLALAILSVLFLLTVTACQTESQEEETPLIIGNLNAFTGSLAEFGPPLRNAIELASEHVNRAGGVNGQSVLIVSRDTAVNPVQGVDAAGALVNIERVVAIVGALSSGVTVAAANAVTIPQETILISGASTAPSITVLEDNDFVFRTTPPTPPRAWSWPASPGSRVSTALASCILTTPTARALPTSLRRASPLWEAP